MTDFTLLLRLYIHIWNVYLQSCIQSLRYVKSLELLVIFGQMLFHWLTDEIIIL